ncbi:MAG: hypothetical protein EOO07_21725 [Chitinophagaceae bacterium]|nr:MAG: hypothetical protein EOO07_21725 [Chitinophagaceae bacterium]
MLSLNMINAIATKQERAKLPAGSGKRETLETEKPISEKDEVKKAEERLNKPTDPKKQGAS